MMLRLERFPLGCFLDAVERHADRVAVKQLSQEWTFRDVHRLSDQLACVLSLQGIKKGDRVGVLMERTPTLVIALLAIIKMGAVYVPIDPEMPLERIKYIQEAAQLKGV